MENLHLIIPDEILTAIEACRDDDYIIRLIDDQISKSFGSKSLEKAAELLEIYKDLIEGSGK